jgi:hypothetical protein
MSRVRPRRAGMVVGVAVLACLTGGCGRKTLPKPPELVAPEAVGELALTTRQDGVALRWSRPTRYVDGSSMDDLGGFVIERNRFNSRFEEIARVPVTDQGRFRKLKRFDYIDRNVLPGNVYHYRVVAFTTDGYYSAPSGAASITFPGSPASPPLGPTPGADPG